MKYVIIDENKVPQHSLDQTYEYDEVKDYPNLAVLVEEPYVVLDIDNNDEAYRLYEILTKLNIKTRIMKTDRGSHFWFKSIEPLTNVIHSNTPITLKVDVKSWGKKSLVTVKKKGENRLWLVENEEIDYLPFWLRPIKSNKDLFDLGEGDGRDDGLYTYIIPLLKNKFSKQQIEDIFNIINNHIFKTPLTNKEIEKMFKDNTIFDETMCFYEKKEFLHDEFAKWLKQNYNIEFYNDSLYLYKDGLYKPDSSTIQEYMIQKIPKLKQHQRNEVLSYLTLICNSRICATDNMLVNVKNGMIDIESKRLVPHSPKVFSINQLDIIYNPGHVDPHVDSFLNTLSNNDSEIRNLLEEIIGYLLLNDCRFQTAFILLGQGANGKSVFLKMLSEFLGQDNISSVSLEKLGEKFDTAELVGKMANLGDDISAEYLIDSSIFKKLVSGERMTVQRKFGHPFQFANRAKMIFSANNLPPSSDKSYGFERRLIIVPFLRTFKNTDDDYDPNIIRKITTQSAKQYLLNLGLNAINRVIQNNKFTKSIEVNKILEEYIIENNNIIQWIQTQPEYLEVDTVNVYRNYCFYCTTNNTKPYKKQKFITEMLIRIPEIRIKNTTRNGKFTQVFSDK